MATAAIITTATTALRKRTLTLTMIVAPTLHYLTNMEKLITVLPLYIALYSFIFMSLLLVICECVCMNVYTHARVFIAACARVRVCVCVCV